MFKQGCVAGPLTPALSRERERGRTLLPLAGEGGAKRRMRAIRPPPLPPS